MFTLYSHSALLNLVVILIYACNEWHNKTKPQNVPKNLHHSLQLWNQTCSLSEASKNQLDKIRLNAFSLASTEFSVSSSITTGTRWYTTYDDHDIFSDGSCPEMIPMWWSAAGTILATFLIEYDRFLAIKYPLLYPEMVSDERSVFACIACQIGCLCLILAVRHISPESFLCEQMVGDVVMQVFCTSPFNNLIPILEAIID